jgi:hypothetical protein
VRSQSVSGVDCSQSASRLVSELVTEPLRFTRRELLPSEADRSGRGKFGNPEERECSPLEAVTKRQVETYQAEKI